LCQHALKHVNVCNGLIDFHPQPGLIAFLHQPARDPATAGKPGLHGTDQAFGINAIAFGDPVVDEKADQLSE
jgi:hypothetical protein